ncbi:MAG: right-handed parallel beta-helix repeat-containing protein, partial [Planctomycetaceae bacterium]|nr:right-handed parallel beta-helix repeat-containing protein [Planctomycetaceae bacterium]
MKLSWVILLSCLLAPLSVFAVEPVTLTVAQPETGALLKTMAELRELRQQGLTDPVVIQIPSGTYRLTEPLQLTAADVESGLKFLATGNEPVVFSGARLLNAAGRTERGLVRYAVPEGINWEVLPRLLLVEGQIMTPGRYPDQGYLRIEKALPDRRSGFTIPADSPEVQIRPATGYDLIFLHDWSSSRIPVKQYDSSTRTLTTTGPIGCEASHYAIDHFEAHPRYYLEGHPAFVNLPGEWYADQETREILVKPFSDEADPIVELPLLTTLIEATGQEDKPLSGLIFQGIVFSGTGFPMPPGGYAAAQASMHEPRDTSGARLTKNRPMLDAAVTISIARHCRFLNCQFVQLGGTGLWIGSRSRECVVQRCKFSRIGGNGLNIGEDNSRHVNGKVWFSAAPEQIPTGNRIEQCEIADCGVVLPGAVGIWAPLHRELQIVQNHLHDCPYTGISLGWMWNDSVTPAGGNVISGNHIEYVMQVLSDGGGIYTLGRQPDSIIENNRIHDIPLNAGRAESNGMFLDEGSTGFVIRGNEIRRITKSPLRFHRAGQNTASGNRWELRDAETPPIRFNNTPAENITSLENEVVSPQKRIYLIGNSLTWDTIPSLLDEAAEWHVDCGKPLPYIHAH